MNEQEFQEVNQIIEKRDKQHFKQGVSSFLYMTELTEAAWKRIRPLKVLAETLGETTNTEKREVLFAHLVDTIRKVEDDFHSCAECIEGGGRFDLLNGVQVEEEEEDKESVFESPENELHRPTSKEEVRILRETAKSLGWAIECPPLLGDMRRKFADKLNAETWTENNEAHVRNLREIRAEIYRILHAQPEKYKERFKISKKDGTPEALDMFLHEQLRSDLNSLRREIKDAIEVIEEGGQYNIVECGPVEEE